MRFFVFVVAMIAMINGVTGQTEAHHEHHHRRNHHHRHQRRNRSNIIATTSSMKLNTDSTESIISTTELPTNQSDFKTNHSDSMTNHSDRVRQMDEGIDTQEMLPPAVVLSTTTENQSMAQNNQSMIDTATKNTVQNVTIDDRIILNAPINPIKCPPDHINVAGKCIPTSNSNNDFVFEY